jgi:hypothetical protein
MSRGCERTARPEGRGELPAEAGTLTGEVTERCRQATTSGWEERLVLVAWLEDDQEADQRIV